MVLVSVPGDLYRRDGMDNRVKQYFEGVKVAEPKSRKQKKKITIKTPRYWVAERPLIALLDKRKINESEFILLLRIENFCYYDQEEQFHCFYGSNRYLATLANCSTRTIQRMLSHLQEMGFLLTWTKTTKDKFGNVSTRRLICTKWSKDKVCNGKKDQ
jgi:hypothetical protein